MDYEFIDTFASGTMDLWTIVGAAVIDSNNRFYDPYSVSTGNGIYSYLKRPVPSFPGYCGLLRFKVINFEGSNPGNMHAVICFGDANQNFQCSIGWRNVSGNYCLCAYRGRPVDIINNWNSAGNLVTGNTPIYANQAYTIEFKVIPAANNGIVQVRLDGASPLAIDYTGNTLAANSSANIGWVNIGAIDYIFDGMWDDCILGQNGFPGSTIKIQKLQVTGNGSANQWTPSTGLNWECVAQIPANDTTFTGINLANQADLFTHGNLTGNISSIKAVQLQARVMQEGTPTPTQLAVGMRAGNNNYWGTNQATIGSFNSVSQLWETNPATGNAFTEAEVNGIQIGYISRP